jgi:type IV pilus assembly protein PilB
MAAKFKLGELLVQAGMIDEAQLRAALGEQGKWGNPLGMTIVRMGFLDEETLIRTLARHLQLPLAWLRGKRVKDEVLALVPGEIASKYRCMPLASSNGPEGRVIFLAMQDPSDLNSIDEIGFKLGCKIKPVLVAPSELENALGRHYPEIAKSQAGRPLDLNDSIPIDDAGEPELLLLDRESSFVVPGGEAPLEFMSDPMRPNATPELDALCRLVAVLIKKGVFSRDDFIARI